MKGIAVVAECNPFHIGHQYLVTGIKEKYPHHALVAIMSGNYVQRGDFAIADKYIRAKTLIEGGLDLVLELPFPFNVLSAEGFAFGGVSVAKRLGEIAYLAFGSEYPDVDLFIKGRDILFSHALEQSLSNKIRMNPTLPYAVLREQCFYEQAEGFPSDFIRSPNCILGLSYMMALKNTSITPILFPRKQIGQEKHDGVSGQHVRRLIVEKQDGWQGFLSPQTKEILDHAEEQGRFPVVAKNVEKAMLYTLRNGDEGKIKTYYGCAPLASRICRAAKQAKSLEELYALVSAKQYPRARIRRAVLAAVLGIGEEEAKQEPECTVVLGANSKGREFLRQIKKTASVSIFTKPAHAVQSGKMLPSWLRAEALYSLAFPKPREEGWYMKTSPYLIEKESVQ